MYFPSGDVQTKIGLWEFMSMVAPSWPVAVAHIIRVPSCDALQISWPLGPLASLQPSGCSATHADLSLSIVKVHEWLAICELVRCFFDGEPALHVPILGVRGSPRDGRVAPAHADIRVSSRADVLPAEDVKAGKRGVDATGRPLPESSQRKLPPSTASATLRCWNRGQSSAGS